jgi:hypothetical protein
MEKTGKVKQINQEIKNLEKIRDEIQNGCLHKKTIIKFDISNTPRVVCSECEKNLKYPNQKELEDFLINKKD